MRNGAQFEKRLATLVGKMTTLAEDWHELAVECMEHMKANDYDSSRLTHMALAGRNTGINRRSFILWCQEHGKLSWKQIDGEWKFKKASKDAKVDSINVEKAKAEPYYNREDNDGKDKADVKAFNVWQRLEAAIKRNEKLRAMPAEERAAAIKVDESVLMDERDERRVREIIARMGPAGNA